MWQLAIFPGACQNDHWPFILLKNERREGVAEALWFCHLQNLPQRFSSRDVYQTDVQTYPSNLQLLVQKGKFVSKLTLPCPSQHDHGITHEEENRANSWYLTLKKIEKLTMKKRKKTIRKVKSRVREGLSLRNILLFQQ